MMRNSILGQEFINYRKNTDRNQRTKFSDRVRNKGMGYIPIVVDSVDPELSLFLSTKQNPRYIKYGLEIIIHMDLTIADLLKEIQIEFLKRDHEYTNLFVGLEDGSIPKANIILGDLYKKHRNIDDKILYVLLTRETTIYNYIISIIKYLALTSQNSIKQLANYFI